MHRTVAIAVAAVACLMCGLDGRAGAATQTVVPAGGGLPALDVKVDLAGPAIDANGLRLKIPLERAELPGEGDVAVEAIAIGRGQSVVHVRVPVKDDAVGRAWEAILAAGRSRPLFAGMTGLTDGDPGERTGKAIQIVVDGPKSFVLVGDVHEDLSLCGHGRALLDPMAVYPQSLDLRPATLQRLSAEERAAARTVMATVAPAGGAEPLAKLLVARGSSVSGSRGAELTDGNAHTLWTERRPGVGQGEFVVMAAPGDVPIARLRIVVATATSKGAGNGSARGPANGAAPRTFYLVATGGIVEVTIPEDGWLTSGTYDISFPQPIEATCLALVLDSAFTRGAAHPDVAIAELQAFSEFDAPGATLDEVAAHLSGPRGLAAAEVLERAGDGALAAVERAWDGLDARGHALAIDVAAAHERCEEAAALLARGLCGHDGEAARRAREKLDRCKEAAPVLAKGVRDDAARRVCLAPTLAAIAPLEAADPIADAMAVTAEEDRSTRAVLRASLAEALKAAPLAMVAAMIADSHRGAATRLEVLRAAEGRLGEAAVVTDAAVTDLLGGSPPMRTRYLVIEPLQELARAGDGAAATRLAQLVARDPDWPVRAHAAEAGAGVGAMQAALVAAVRDPEPRVREAALQSIAVSPPPAAIEAAGGLLRQDAWPFVRVQAAWVLAKAPGASDVDAALGSALHDGAVDVRGAALAALARRRSWAWRKEIRERLDDAGEETAVRAAAARAAGAVCDRDSADRLTELARGLGVRETGEDAQQVGLAALTGLAELQPRDLRERLTPLIVPSVPPYVRAAALQALAARGGCLSF